MIREVLSGDRKIQYDLITKDVKNINLRIREDGSVCVSAGRYVPHSVVDDFVISKADFIFKARDRFNNMTREPLKQYFAENEIREVILRLCEEVYPYFEIRGVKYPQVKFRKMKTQWGSCNAEKGILSFNTYLMYAPEDCIEYVVMHEFTHFLVPNHSRAFYEELAKVCPYWRLCRKKLKAIQLR